MATYKPVWLGNTPDYETDAYIRLWIDGHSGNTNTEVQRIYISRWNQADNTWGADSRHDTQEFNYGSPGTTVGNRLYRWRARGWRSDSGFSDYSYSHYVATTPRAPANVSAWLSGPNAVSLSWTDTAYEPYYPYETQVWWSINGGAWVHGETVPAGTTSRYYPNQTPGSTLQFAVQHVETNNRNIPGGLNPTLGSGLVYSGVVTAYQGPAAPSGLSATRNSDAQATLTWTNNASGGAPYSSLTLQRWDNVGNSWDTIANLGGGVATATDGGLVAGRKYQWRIIANNGMGSSDAAYSGNVFTTPSAPSNVVGSYVGGTTVRATWANTVSYSEYGVRLQVYKNGVADGAVISLNGGTTSYDVTGVVNTATYSFRVWAVSNVGGLASSQTASGNVTPALPPAAPGSLNNPPVVDLTRYYEISWAHNASTDGSAQRQYQLRYRTLGSSTWIEEAVVTSSASFVGQPWDDGPFGENGPTVEWQVRTWGVHADPSPYSASSTFVTSWTPTVTVTGPTTPVITSAIMATWSYYDAPPQNTPQAEWRADLYDAATGDVLERLSGTGGQQTCTFAYKAQDGGSYRVEVTVRDGSGLWSDKGVRSFQTAFTPPAPVDIVPELDPASGAGVISIVLPDADRADQIARTNLCRNPSAETNSTHWTTWAGTGGVATFSRSSTGGAFGSSWLRLSWSTAATSEGSAYTETAAGTVAAGDKITASAYVRSANARTMRATIEWRDSAGALIGAGVQGTGIITSSTNWIRVSVTGTAPAGVSHARVIIWTGGAAVGVGEWIDIDGCLIEKSDTVREYFDGSRTVANGYYYGWTGTAHNSTSVQKFIGNKPGAIVSTNLHTNPGAEGSSLSMWSTANGATVALGAAYGINSPTGARYSCPANGIGDSGANIAGTMGTQIGRTYTVSVDIRAITPGDYSIGAQGPGGPVAQNRTVKTLAAGEVARLTYTWTANQSGVSPIYVLRSNANKDTVTDFDLDNVVIEEASATTASGYFHGGAARDSLAYYEWTGTANNSTSIKKQIGSFPVSAVTVERRFYDPEAETYGDWEVLIEEAPPEAVLIDPTAPAHDDGEYRVTAHSAAPSTYRRPNYTVKPVNSLDNRWLYVSGGPNFEVVCKMWANIEIEQTASRSKALHYFAGRKNPVIYSGEMAERTYTVSGILEDEASNPNQWIRLARQAGPVLLRAPGRRMYGSLSEVAIERIQNGLHRVSFSIQEVAI